VSISDWRLTYDGQGVWPGADIAFGAPLSPYIFTGMPDTDAAPTRSDDTDLPREDGIVMGVDSRGGLTIPISLTVNGRTEDEGDRLESSLARAWRADAVRRTPGAVATLRSHRGRRTFGRPRRYFADGRRSHLGRYDVTADFATVTDLWFGDDRAFEASIVAASSGGFRAPFRFPLVTTGFGAGSQSVVVDGDVPAWCRIEIDGPILNPDVEIFGVLREQFTTYVPEGQTLVFDPRPWSRGVLLDGINVSGRRLRTSTPLASAVLPPGEHLFTLRGQSETGTARARVIVAPAFTRY